MTTKHAGIQKYVVRHTEPFEEESVVAGVMAIDAEQRVEVISSEEQFADEMELAASSRTGAGGLLLLKSRARSSQKRKDHKGLKDCAIAQWRRAPYLRPRRLNCWGLASGGSMIGSIIPKLRFLSLEET